MQLRIQRLLSRHYRISTTEALALLATGEVMVNGAPAQINQRIHKNDSVTKGEEIIQKTIVYQYIAIYKPRGIECTSNPLVEERLDSILPESYKSLYNVGRLDKDTEGLLFLTNDSDFYDAVADSASSCEKEYRVTVKETLTEEALQTMRSGMIIMGQKTRPCTVSKVDDYIFHITLTQGLNRQIRRICYKLNYTILELKRVRIGNISLGKLSSENLFRSLTTEEVKEIFEKEKKKEKE